MSRILSGGFLLASCFLAFLGCEEPVLASEHALGEKSPHLELLISGDQHDLSGLVLDWYKGSVWATSSSGAMRLSPAGEILETIMFGDVRLKENGRRKNRPVVVPRFVPLNSGEYGFVGTPLGKPRISVFFDEDGNQARLGRCGYSPKSLARLRAGEELELFDAHATRLTICNARTLEARLINRPSDLGRVASGVNRESILDGATWIYSVDTLDLDQDGAEELLVATSHITNKKVGETFQHAVYDGRDFSLIQEWHRAEKDGAFIAAVRIHGVPLIAHLTTRGLALDEIGGRRWRHFTLEVARHHGTFQYVGWMDGVGLIALARAGREAITLLSVFDCGTGDLLLSKRFDRLGAGAVVVAEASGKSSLWFSIGPDIYALRRSERANPDQATGPMRPSNRSAAP